MTATARVLCTLALAVSACTGPTTEVPLALLTHEQEAYDDRLVSTQGVVVPIVDSPGGDEYFVLEDHMGNRVRALPDAVARRYAGQTVAVSGTFRFNPNAGRELRIATIERSQ